MTMLGLKHSADTKRKIGASNAIALKGKKQSKETKAKRSTTLKAMGHKPAVMVGKNHPSWKGASILYGSLHDWVSAHRGKPSKCEHCGLKNPRRMYHWANKSHEYRRNLKDWIRLCVPCHKKYDKKK